MYRRSPTAAQKITATTVTAAIVAHAGRRALATGLGQPVATLRLVRGPRLGVGVASSSVASRKQQKEAARAAREQAVAQLTVAQQRRRARLLQLGGVVLVVWIAAAVVLIVVSSSGGGTPQSVLTRPQANGAYDNSPTAARAEVERTLGGITQAGNRLGDPAALVTITEYGDLVSNT